MIATSQIIDDGAGDAICEMCSGSLLGERYVRAEGALLFFLCSEPCFRALSRRRTVARWAARRRYTRTLAVGAILATGFLTPHEGPLGRPRIKVAAAAARPVREARPDRPMAPGWYGPEWPPTEQSLLAALGRDAWVHPLAGPVRRMPLRDSRVFGAARPGERPVECRNGHCGVDLGGELWGEHVHAVHDGVVDRVQRGPNPDHGGEYVRLAHRNGTVFTQYFHLAAIPRGLKEGMAVKGGQVIGLLGDSGVKESTAHLHFTISVRPSKDTPERYIDPEPLIALWPLRVPLDGSEAGLVTTVARPGLPLGSAPLAAGRKRKAAAAAALAAAGSGAAPAAADEKPASRESDDADDESSDATRSASDE
jgi:murein DD-endopeptidase MepM/ murein hydrolase activator NlpD